MDLIILLDEAERACRRPLIDKQKRQRLMKLLSNGEYIEYSLNPVCKIIDVMAQGLNSDLAIGGCRY